MDYKQRRKLESTEKENRNQNFLMMGKEIEHQGNRTQNREAPLRRFGHVKCMIE